MGKPGQGLLIPTGKLWRVAYGRKCSLLLRVQCAYFFKVYKRGL